MAEKKLNKLRRGEHGRVSALEEGRSETRRLAVLGLVRGTEVVMERRGIFGDPVVVSLRGYSLALRASEAALITIEE